MRDEDAQCGLTVSDSVESFRETVDSGSSQIRLAKSPNNEWTEAKAKGKDGKDLPKLVGGLRSCRRLTLSGAAPLVKENKLAKEAVPIRRLAEDAMLSQTVEMEKIVEEQTVTKAPKYATSIKNDEDASWHADAPPLAGTRAPVIKQTEMPDA